jgi:iron complex outermembrane receptor protein
VNAPDLNGNGTREDEEIADFLSFDPETVDSYELGYKGSLLDGALYLALAGFYMDYSDVQIPGSVACSAGGVATFCGVISNAGKAEYKGVEIETNARLARDFVTPGDRLNFIGSLGYIDAEYKEYITNIAGVPTDVAEFREVQNTPEWSGSATLAYSTPAGEGDVYFGTTLSYKSRTYQFEIPNPYFDQDEYALLDASLVYTAPGDRWSIGLHGKNLTDVEYKTSGYTFMTANPLTGVLLRDANGNPTPALGREGVLTAFYGNPRQVYVSGTIRF